MSAELIAWIMGGIAFCFAICFFHQTGLCRSLEASLKQAGQDRDMWKRVSDERGEGEKKARNAYIRLKTEISTFIKHAE